MGRYSVEKRKINSDEYLSLRSSTDWQTVSREQVERGLDTDLFSVCVFHGEKIVGIGRIIGDGSIYFYIQDVIVMPGHQKNGVGRRIMEAIEDYLEKNAPVGAFIGLMAADGTQGFYQKFGYRPRPSNKPGMHKVINEV